MKKIIVFVFIMAALISFSVPQIGFAYAESPKREIRTLAVYDEDTEGLAVLTGVGENYVTDVVLTVKFDGFPPYSIALPEGYSPYMETFDFGGEDKFLFYSSQTGGSGGYGSYRVYRLKTDSYELLYDDSVDSETATFSAAFLPDGFMELRDGFSGNVLSVYVGYMDKTFYNRIFSPDGSLKGEQPYVNAISFVSPSLNSSSGIYRLLTYRSVVAVAEVNRLGYIVQTLDFDGKTFVPTFTEFSIAL